MLLLSLFGTRRTNQVVSILPADGCHFHSASNRLHQKDPTTVAGEDCPVLLDGLGITCAVSIVPKLVAFQKVRVAASSHRLRQDDGVESDRGIYGYHGCMQSGS